MYFAGRNIVTIILATIATYIFYINGSMPFNLTGYIPPGIAVWKLPNMTTYDAKANRTYDLNDMSNVSSWFHSIICFDLSQLPLHSLNISYVGYLYDETIYIELRK